MRARNFLTGMLIYPLGDAVAAWILDDFSFTRMFGMMGVGCTLYALEIPNYFAWLDRKGYPAALRGVLTVAFFNPLWISRHFAFITLFSGQELSWDILNQATKSFALATPVTISANILMQTWLPLWARFFASATFSGAMAIYYAAARVLLTAS